MKFFAILENGRFASRIMRFKLDQTAENLMKNVIDNGMTKFELVDSEIPFSADYTPSQNEIFIIDGFDSEVNLQALLTNPNSIQILELSNKQDNISLNDIVGIIATDDINKRFIIQYFEKRNIIELSRSIIQRKINNKYEFVAATSNGISLPTDVIAVIDSSNKLKFKSFQRLRHIFNMDKYFKEATDEELNEFIVNCSKLEATQGFEIERIDDTTIRKKITIINKSGVLENYSVDELKKAAEKVGYPLPLNSQENKIQLPNNKKQFKDLLQFLSSNIYEDPISHTTRITNSSRPYSS